MWAQKARSDWIIQGDRNTKYFQTLVKQRRARSKILDLKTDEGIITEDYEVIESTLVNHFKNQFSEIGISSFHSQAKEQETLPIPKIDQHQQATLDML